jgi:hypothetical protein
MWKHGQIKINWLYIDYQAKVYPEPSRFGINQGRISKLSLRVENEEVYWFDRGLDFDHLPDDIDINRVVNQIEAIYV